MRSIKTNAWRLFGFCAFWMCVSGSVIAQGETQQAPLTFDDYILLVKANNMIAKQADNLIPLGEAEVLGARGAFDPKLASSLSQKFFKQDNYYSLFDATLKVPTMMGLDINAGYDRTSGVFLNPEENNPDQGLIYAGVSLPIGRGLFMDERRTQLQQAEIMLQASAAERLAILNDLIYDAGKTYWSWWESYTVQNVYEEGLRAAEFRYQSVVIGSEQGDRPSIDTVEAMIQIQNLQLLYDQARIDYLNNTILLSTYLWDGSGNPLIFRESVIPDLSAEVVLPDLLPSEVFDATVANHPDIILNEFKLESLDVERRLTKENMKPIVDLKYNFLIDAGVNPLTNISPNNMNWGLQVGMPLFLRKERAALQKTDIKIEQTRFEQLNKIAVLSWKLQKAYNEWQLSYDQYELYSEVVTNYFRLLEGERELFNNGESSLFVINSRQLSYITARIKQLSLLSKNRKAELLSYYAAGTIATN